MTGGQGGGKDGGDGKGGGKGDGKGDGKGCGKDEKGKKGGKGGGKDENGKGCGKDEREGQDGEDVENGEAWPSWDEVIMKGDVDVPAILAEQDRKIWEFRVQTERRLDLLREHMQMLLAQFKQMQAVMDKHTACLDRMQSMQNLAAGHQAPHLPPGLQIVPVQYGGSSSSFGGCQPSVPVQYGGSSSSFGVGQPSPQPAFSYGGATNVNVGQPQPPPPPPRPIIQGDFNFADWGPYCRCVIKGCRACKENHSRDNKGRCQNSIGRYCYHKDAKRCKWCYDIAFPDA